jgi:hypothetical protein
LPLVWMLQRLNYHLKNTPPLADQTPPQTPLIAPMRDALIPFFPKDFFEDAGASVIRQDIRNASTADQHAPWEIVSLLRPKNLRVINQVPVARAGKLTVKGRIQHADPIREMIHVSAFERLRQTIKIDTKTAKYNPANLLAAIPFVAASYLRRQNDVPTPWADVVKRIFTWQRIYVVDWDGTPLDPGSADDARRVFKIIPNPRDIGVTTMPLEMKNFVLE